jgi:hypothetical protein
MKLYTILVLTLVLVTATTAFGLQKKAWQTKDDFGTVPTYDGALQYYYYVPCPTYSWFWAYTGWTPGDYVGMSFTIGDQGTGGNDPLDPTVAQSGHSTSPATVRSIQACLQWSSMYGVLRVRSSTYGTAVLWRPTPDGTTSIWFHHCA